MRKLLKPLSAGFCEQCSRRTLVRIRHNYETEKPVHLCTSCAPVDGDDMIQDGRKLALASH